MESMKTQAGDGLGCEDLDFINIAVVNNVNLNVHQHEHGTMTPDHGTCRTLNPGLNQYYALDEQSNDVDGTTNQNDQYKTVCLPTTVPHQENHRLDISNYDKQVHVGHRGDLLPHLVKDICDKNSTKFNNDACSSATDKPREQNDFVEQPSHNSTSIDIDIHSGISGVDQRRSCTQGSDGPQTERPTPDLCLVNRTLELAGNESGCEFIQGNNVLYNTNEITDSADTCERTCLSDTDRDTRSSTCGFDGDFSRHTPISDILSDNGCDILKLICTPSHTSHTVEVPSDEDDLGRESIFINEAFGFLQEEEDDFVLQEGDLLNSESCTDDINVEHAHNNTDIECDPPKGTIQGSNTCVIRTAKLLCTQSHQNEKTIQACVHHGKSDDGMISQVFVDIIGKGTVVEPDTGKDTEITSTTAAAEAAAVATAAAVAGPVEANAVSTGKVGSNTGESPIYVALGSASAPPPTPPRAAIAPGKRASLCYRKVPVPYSSRDSELINTAFAFLTEELDIDGASAVDKHTAAEGILADPGITMKPKEGEDIVFSCGRKDEGKCADNVSMEQEVGCTECAKPPSQADGNVNTASVIIGTNLIATEPNADSELCHTHREHETVQQCSNLHQLLTASPVTSGNCQHISQVSTPPQSSRVDLHSHCSDGSTRDADLGLNGENSLSFSSNDGSQDRLNNAVPNGDRLSEESEKPRHSDLLQSERTGDLLEGSIFASSQPCDISNSKNDTSVEMCHGENVLQRSLANLRREGLFMTSGSESGSLHSSRSSDTETDLSGVKLRTNSSRSRGRARGAENSSVRSGSSGERAGSDCSSLRSSEDGEDVSDDDDGGIYDETFRYSSYMYIGKDQPLTMAPVMDMDLDDVSGDASVDQPPSDGRPAGKSPQGCNTFQAPNGSLDPISDIGWTDDDNLAKLPVPKGHSRSESVSSVSTTASEQKFRNEYRANRTVIVQRQSSHVAYKRLSDKLYEMDREIAVQKERKEKEFGFHIWGTKPVIVSTVEPGSAADRSGVQVGDVLVLVNDINVLEATHKEVIALLKKNERRVRLGMAAERMASDLPLCCGYLCKQGGMKPFRSWKRRWFELKPDNCLYYYKNQGEHDPLGAIPVINYHVRKALECSKKFAFKLLRYTGDKTYFLQADTEDDMTKWANAIQCASTSSHKSSDSWLEVSSHNVGVPALSIKGHDCHGILYKMGNRNRGWKRRYCVLKQACLYYYIDMQASTAKGVAHFHGYNVDSSTSFTPKKFSFMLVPPDPNMRTFYFYAENETEMKRWQKAFKSSIGRWVALDT